METIRGTIASAARPLRDARGPCRPHKERKDAGEDRYLQIFHGFFIILLKNPSGSCSIHQRKKGFFNYRLSMLMPVKSCATSRISFTPNAVWTCESSIWFAASHI